MEKQNLQDAVHTLRMYGCDDQSDNTSSKIDQLAYKLERGKAFKEKDIIVQQNNFTSAVTAVQAQVKVKDIMNT